MGASSSVIALEVELCNDWEGSKHLRSCWMLYEHVYVYVHSWL